MEGEGLPIATLSGYIGDDRERGLDKAVGRTIAGARATYERRLDFGAKLVATGAYQRSEYGGQNVFFNTIREDKRMDLSVGLVFSPAKDVTLTPQYMYTENRSNIPVVDFRRHQIFVNLRRDFP